MGASAPRHEDTRQRLLDAAFALFDQHGFADTTIEMIAAAAGVSARTFHRHFETKDGVLAEAGHRIVAHVVRDLSAGATTRQLIGALIAAFDTDRRGHELERTLRTRRDNPEVATTLTSWRQRWAEDLAQAIATIEGRGHPTLADRVRSHVAITLAAVSAEEWLEEEGPVDLSDTAREALEVLSDDLTA